ncbi:MAG TPA: DUF3592 domain-containing protein [Tepidisphaeraceae bacterium]|jgi:hypothetical protein
MKHAVTLFTLVAAMFVALGANRAMEQQREFEHVRPTQGTVISASVRQFKPTTGPGAGHSGTTYAPDVRYRYSLLGSVFGSNQVFVRRGMTTSRARAEQIVAQFPAGKAVMIWYDPDKPGESFLVRDFRFEPYLIILYSMILLAVGLGIWAARPWQRAKVWPPKPPREGNWRELTPRVTLAAARHPWRAVSMIWYVMGGVAIAHYFMHADRPYPLEALIASPVYLALGLIPIARWLRHRRLARVANDARLWVNTETFRPGKTFDVRVEQSFRRPVTIRAARVGLVCGSARNPNLFETWQELTADRGADRDRPVSGKTKLTPPEQISDPMRAASWRVVVETQIRGRPDYRAEFPIALEADAA